MVIVMKKDSTNEDIQEICSFVESFGLKTNVSHGIKSTVVGVIGDKKVLEDVDIESMSNVAKVIHISESYKLAHRSFHPENTIIKIKDLEIGGKEIAVIGGPCAIENRDQLLTTAKAVKAAGAQILRGGAYKPRTSPYSFQGLEEEGLKLMKEASELTGLITICEVIDEASVETASKYIDILQVGARNMQNFHLLKAVGKTGMPVLLKRGLSSTIDEWLNAAEYILSEGNPNVILCERGIRTYETATRNTLDLSAVPIIKNLSHLPIIVDPSHGTGKRICIHPMSLAAIAAGADGLAIEVHPDPKHALSDGPQSLKPEDFTKLCDDIAKIAPIVNRRFK
jgi:3-deoxy-7-phosphoheptulonate synthase